MCAIICPEAIIEVYKDSNIVAIDRKRKEPVSKPEVAAKESNESVED